MQNVLNSSPYAQYQPYGSNYYQGKYPQYNSSYYQTPQISTVDWKFVNECNADMIRINEDIDKMNQILNLISRSDFQSDSQTNQNPNILKLLSLVQVIINYLLKCQDELKEKNNELIERNTKYENDSKKNTKSSNYYKEKLGKAITILKKSKTRERCPRCHKTLQSLNELDNHMRTNHNNLWREWVAVRNGKELPKTSQNESKLQKKVNKLEKQVEDLIAKQRSQYYNDSYNTNKKDKQFHPALFDTNNVKAVDFSSSEGQATKQQPPPPPQVQPQPIIQTPTKTDDIDNLARLNAKKHAEDFLSHRRPAAPMHPQQVDEIVHKISSMLHEQSKQVSYGEAVKEENPEELRQDISDDVKSDHPMPETSTINNLKDLKKPIKTPKRKRAKKQKLQDEEESKEETPTKPTDNHSDHHCYGDSMPLSSSSLRNSFVFSSEMAQYDSTAIPSSAPHRQQKEESSGGNSASQSESKTKKPDEKPDEKQTNIQDSGGAENDSENSFHSDSGHSKFELPSNDNDFATYEEFISADESDHHSKNKPKNNHDASEEEEVYYYEVDDDEDATNQKVQPTNNPKNTTTTTGGGNAAAGGGGAGAVRPDDEFEYSYTYEDEIPESKGFIHPSPQPSNKSLKGPVVVDDDEFDDESY